LRKSLSRIEIPLPVVSAVPCKPVRAQIKAIIKGGVDRLLAPT
jgi:hypothetical protein